MNKEQKELIKVINKAYDELHVLDNITWTSYRKDLLKHNIKEERSHRNFGNDWSSYHDNAKVSDCAKLFVVKHIAEAILDPNQFEMKDIIRIKKSIPLSVSLVANYKDRIVKAWKDQDIKYLANLDYIMLVNYDLYLEQQQRRNEVAYSKAI